MDELLQRQMPQSLEAEQAVLGAMLIDSRCINDVIGIGGIALKSPFVMQTLSNVLNMPIKVCNTDQACALGAAMFAATAAGAYATVADAQDAMNSGFAKEYIPEPDQVKIYDEVYQRYLKLGAYCEEVAK